MYTHTGYRPQVGRRNCGRLHGHDMPRPGVTHALVIGTRPDRYTALCGETVIPRSGYDEWGDPERPNVRSITDPGVLPVTCSRCKRRIA